MLKRLWLRVLLALATFAVLTTLAYLLGLLDRPRRHDGDTLGPATPVGTGASVLIAWRRVGKTAGATVDPREMEVRL